MIDVHLGPFVERDGLGQRLGGILPAVARMEAENFHSANDTGVRDRRRICTPRESQIFLEQIVHAMCLSVGGR